MGDVPPFFALNRRLTFGGCTVKAICIVATLNLVLIAASPGFAVVTVTWTPPVVSASVLSGTLKTFSVSFISTQTLQDINVAVVPALTPYVRVAPSHFDQVVRGVKNEVQVFVSLQDGTPPGELNGTIQLRSRLTPSNVFGRPLPVLVVANPPTATSIPSVISLPSPDRIVVATAANPSFAANEIDISVVAGTPDSVVEALASSENATFWGRDSRARIYQLRFAFRDFLTALTLAQRLTSSYRFVEFATPSLLFGPFSTIPPDPSWDPSVRADQSWAQLLIDLPNAWDFGTGDVHVRLAVVDSGFVTHPDLNPAPPPESEPDGTDPGHGVAVASLAAAVGNNPGRPIGLAGAMWSSHMVELAASGDDNLAVSRMLDAIDQAKISQDNQGMVINFSGGNDLSPTCFPGIPDAARQYTVSLQKLLWEKPIEYAMANGQQVLFVFSAGNDRVLFDNSLPAALSTVFPNVISVAATDRLANEASYSDYGTVSVWAPGGDESVGMCPLGTRNSTSYLVDPLAKISDPVATILVARADGNPPYDYSGNFIGVGTSLSAPFVSGVAGLMLSKNSSLTAPEIKNFIDATADPTGQLDPSGNDIRVLNAFHAVQQAIANPEFDFALDSLLVVGNVNGGAGFFDDFNDGSLSVPPTSNINCNLNTAPVSESGGFLHLSSADGANTFTPGALVDNCFLGLDATAYRFNKGSGGATITASFRADAPLPAQAYGLQLFTLGTDELVSIFVTNNGAGPVIGALTKTASDVVMVENVPLNLTSVQRVFLRLTYNDFTNQVTQSFSTNGTTFTMVSVSQPGTVMTTGSQALTSVFGSVQLATSP